MTTAHELVSAVTTALGDVLEDRDRLADPAGLLRLLLDARETLIDAFDREDGLEAQLRICQAVDYLTEALAVLAPRVPEMTTAVVNLRPVTTLPDTVPEEWT